MRISHAAPLTTLSLSVLLASSSCINSAPTQPAAPQEGSTPKASTLSEADRKAIEEMRAKRDEIYEREQQERLQQRKEELKEKMIATLKTPALSSWDFERAMAQWLETKPSLDDLVTLFLPYLKTETHDARDSNIQVYAIRAIADYGAQAKTVTPTLIELLDKGKDWQVIHDAAIALSLIAPQDPTAIAALIRAVDKNFQTYHIARIIGDIKPPIKQAVPSLIRALDAGTGDDRYEAYVALGKITGSNEKLSLQSQIKRLQRLNYLPPAHTAAAFLAVQAQGRVALGALPTLVKIIESRPTDYLLSSAIVTLGKVGPGASRDATQTLLNVMAEYKGTRFDDSMLMRQAVAAMKFSPQDTAAVEPLTRALSAAHPEVRRVAAQSLAAIGPAAAPATTALAKALREADSKTNPEQVFAYLAALARIGPGARGAAGAILEQLKPQSRLFPERDQSQRNELYPNLLNALAHIGVPRENQQEAVERVLEGLASDSAMTFVGAARVAATLGDEARQAVPLLVKGLSASWRSLPIWISNGRLHLGYVASTSPQLEAIKALARMGAAAKPAIPELTRIAEHKPERDRWNDLHEEEHARQALQQIQGNTN